VDEAAIGALVAAELGGPITDHLAELVARGSEGNPLFALELSRALRESGALVDRHGTWSTHTDFGEAELPPTIERVLSARMDLLPVKALPALQAAAVIGRRVPTPLLTDVLPDGDETRRSIGELVERGFLDRAESQLLVFPHALVQDAAYARLLRRQQRELHARVAAAAERRYGAGDEAVELLARHLYLARAGGKAIDYLMRAGLRSVGLFANAEATTHLERAIELVREQPEQHHRLPETLLELAQVYELVGRYDDALARYEEVRASGDMRAWRGAAGVLRKQGRYADALALLDEGLARADAAPDDLAALRLEQGRTELFQGNFKGALRALDAGLAVASPGAAVAAHLLLQLARAQMSAGDAQTALRSGLDALEQLRAHDDARGMATAMRVVGSIYEVLDRMDDAAEMLRAGLAEARRCGDVEEIGGCLLNLGMVEMGRGQPDGAIDSSRRALDEFERVGHQLGAATASANLAEWLVLSERPDESARARTRAQTVSA
jgi:tetratricopeptide (TPR) repeat protein